MKKAVTLFFLVFLQPPALLTWAGLIIVFFVVFQCLGWRDLTTVLTGTFPSELSAPEASSRATLYLVSYFAAILVAPIMILAALLRLSWEAMRAFIARPKR
jgi:hypothetical protein